MSSYSMMSGLQRTLFAATIISNKSSSDSYDVIIRFDSAKNLPQNNLLGYTDPYFIANIDDQISYTSIILANTSEPKWDDEEWVVRNIPCNAKLTVKIYHKDNNKVIDNYIGQFIIPDLINYNPSEKGHKIIGTCGHHSSSFHLSIQSMKSSEETKELPRYTFDGSCRYFRHDSQAIGCLTMVNVDCIYSTWEIQMKRISFFFSPYQRQYWNKEYTLAKAIFSDCPFSTASRRAVQLGYKILYERTSKNNEHGQLYNADDLWKLIFLNKSIQRIKPCVYTYVIDDNSWKFSETSSQIFTDFASKHVLLANCSEYVCYAGEFHPRPKYGWNKYDDEWELVFSNESGTYAPNSDLLVNLQELLLFNFPGLNVVTYDYKDPKLKESLQKLKIETEKYKHMTPTWSTCQSLSTNDSK